MISYKFYKKKYFLVFIAIFALHLFLRFWDVGTKSPFGWDQVINAWAAKDIIIDHKLPLVGMQAKLNSGFYIGPLYSYFIAGFYYLTHLDPIAAPLSAGVISIFTFFALYFVIKKLFSLEIALVAVFLNAISFYIIQLDRIAWPVDFVVPLSVLIFYSLYNILLGKEKHFLLLAVLVGLSFNVHFTSIFYLPIIFLTFPFIPRSKKMLYYFLYSIPLFLIWIFPVFLYEFGSKGASSKNIYSYLSTYSHGFHFRRFLQVAKDAFIEFDGIFDEMPFIKALKYFFPLVFFVLYSFKSISKEKCIIIYLMTLWLLVPWIAFTIYSGEITNYYFSITRPIVLIVFSYLIIAGFNLNIYFKLIIILFMGSFSYVNLYKLSSFHVFGLDYYRKKIDRKIKIDEQVPYKEGDSESYFFYIYKQCKFCQK